VSDASRKIRHVVLVKFRASATPGQRAEFIARSQWSRCAEYVTGYVCGLPVQPNPYAGAASDEWDWGMTLDMAETDVERYRDDPVHQAVAADVGTYAERYSILDFIID
jgi:hypothetical protein